MVGLIKIIIIFYFNHIFGYSTIKRNAVRDLKILIRISDLFIFQQILG